VNAAVHSRQTHFLQNIRTAEVRGPQALEVLPCVPRRYSGVQNVSSLLAWLAGVFGEPNDLTLLGARSFEALNPRVDSYSKREVDAGPAPAAVAA
jgi:hypothetical protein